MENNPTFPRLQLGISSCLLGQSVRYDGSHKRDAYICDVLQQHADFFPLCPEMQIGLGAPRPPIQWINIDGHVRVRAVNKPDGDFTDALNGVADAQLASLQTLDGFIVKSRSPSCGLSDAPIHQADQHSSSYRAGAFTERLRILLPQLPIIDEQQLSDARLREDFIASAYRYARRRRLRHVDFDTD